MQKGRTDRYTTFKTDIRQMKDLLQRQRRPGEKLNLTFEVSGQVGKWDNLEFLIDFINITVKRSLQPHYN